MAKVDNKTKGFNSISRDVVYDFELSDRARFLYVYMACKPDGWEFYQDKVAEELGYKKDTLRKYMDELIKRGWIEEKQQQNNGKFGALEYIIRIERKKGENLPIREKPDTEKTRYGKNPNQRDIDNISSDTNVSSDKEENNKKESIDSKKEKTRFIKPTLEELKEFIEEKKLLHIDAEEYYNYFESVGWVIGKNRPMKSWKASCMTWNNRHKPKASYYDPLPEDDETVLRFKKWMRDNHGQIGFVEKPLTCEGYIRLQKQYGRDEVINQLVYIDANIGRFKYSDIEASIRLYFEREQ